MRSARVLQCVAMCCGVFQHAAGCCIGVPGCCSVPQVCCSVVQGVLQCAAGVLQCGAGCCCYVLQSMAWCVAVCCIMQ